MAAKHPFPVFRVLKQAWRDYLADNCIIAVTLPVDVAVAGRVLANGTMIQRGTTSLKASLTQAGVVKAQQIVPVNTAGAWTVTFTGVTAGAYKLAMACGMQPSINMETSATFTVT
jgi:hypothetical protein